MKKYILAGVGIPTGCLLVMFLVAQARLAHRRIRATGHVLFWTEAAQMSETRLEAYDALRRRVGLHSYTIDLIDAGDKTSVPVLIDLLASDEAQAAYAHESYSCIWGHLLEALTTITKQDFGTNAGAWKHWWDTEGTNMPEGVFCPKSRRRVIPEPYQ